MELRKFIDELETLYKNYIDSNTDEDIIPQITIDVFEQVEGSGGLFRYCGIDSDVQIEDAGCQYLILSMIKNAH